jgi:hypothetical protein
MGQHYHLPSIRLESTTGTHGKTRGKKNLFTSATRYVDQPSPSSHPQITLLAWHSLCLLTVYNTGPWYFDPFHMRVSTLSNVMKDSVCSPGQFMHRSVPYDESVPRASRILRQAREDMIPVNLSHPFAFSHLVDKACDVWHVMCEYGKIGFLYTSRVGWNARYIIHCKHQAICKSSLRSRSHIVTLNTQRSS